MKEYKPKDIESRWQNYWQENNTFEVDEDEDKEKFYALIEFPYPSGSGLHVGHPRPFTGMDVVSRKRRMQGENVLFPIGFDSFGLPTENYAIKVGRPPQEITEENIENFTKQLKSLGFSFDWSRVITTSDPDYYQWTQWIFLKLFKHGLAYKKNEPINWCPDCLIGLANEEVVKGECERCGAEVIKKDKRQWMLAITEYADSLLEGLKEVDYIDQAKIQQRNWIGRSEGAKIDFQIAGLNYNLKVFSTRPDTIFGATYMVVAPEHEMLKDLQDQIKNYEEVEDYIKEAKTKSDLERTELQEEKTGVKLEGVSAINPATGESIPIFVADYVLTNYGTGAIMAVPAHDERDWEFAKKFDLEIKEVIEPADHDSGDKEVFTGEGKNKNSDFLNGLETPQAKEKIIEWLEENDLGKADVNYKLQDWVFSRQRYWGEPIPLVYCDSCAKNEAESEGEEKNPGWVPIPEEELPLELPDVEEYEPTDTGESPLAKMEEWVNTECPRCGSDAKRETDVMPNWAGSSWYFLRYTDPKNDESFASEEALDYWMPVDWYNGGMEHTTLHLLYSRFWNQFLYDIGEVPTKEPYQKRTSHGMILAEGGEKMSKSKGNVVNPDEVIDEFGADALRTYIMFMGPFDQDAEWSREGLVGVRRFIERVWRLQDKISESISKEDKKTADKEVHKAVKKATEDIEDMGFNTAIAQMMECVNVLNKLEGITKQHYQKLIKILSPFAPHMCEEVWHEFLNKEGSIVYSSWPEYKEEYLQEENINIAVQINGKVRDEVEIPADAGEDTVRDIVMGREQVQKYLEGKEPEKFIYVEGNLVSIVV